MSDDSPFQIASGEPDWEAIARVLAGEGAPGEREALSRHLAAHPEHAALVGALDGAASRLGERDRASVDVEGALASVMARRDAPASSPPVPLRAPGWRWGVAALRAAAAVLVLLACGLLWRAPRVAEAPAASYATAEGARRELRLPDGSRVQLGPASTLLVAAGFGGSSREMELRGEAYFEVADDDDRPFIVRTADAVVRDLGTAFAVRAGGAEGTRVVVTSGIVTLAPPAGAADTLRAGDRGGIAEGARVVVERGAATAADVAWTRGELVFRDTPLDEVAAEVRRWYGVTVTVADPALARRRITATFHATDSAGDVLRVVAAAAGGEVRLRGKDATIVRAGAP
jgi:transmembrane sensor